MFFFRWNQFFDAARWWGCAAGVVALGAVSGIVAARAGWDAAGVGAAVLLGLIGGCLVAGAGLSVYINSVRGPHRELLARLAPGASFIGHVDATTFRWLRTQEPHDRLIAYASLPCSVVATAEAVEVYTITPLFPGQRILEWTWDRVSAAHVRPKAIGSARIVLTLTDASHTVTFVVFNNLIRPARRRTVETLAAELQHHANTGISRP